MELKDTVELMQSADYKDRFKAEYWQTKIRYEKLKDFCNKIEASRTVASVNEPRHDCPYDLLREQQHIMGMYLHNLELRAIIENVDLNDLKMVPKFTCVGGTTTSSKKDVETMLKG